MLRARLLTPWFLVSALVGQEGEGRDRDPRDEPGFDPIKAAAQAAQRPSSQEYLDRFVSTIVGARPRRLAPGQSGEIKIIVALRGDAVIVASHALEVRYSPKQGALALGADWSITEAEPAAADSELAGQAVYANTAIVTVPVQVDDDADYGVHWLNLEIDCEITNPTDGKRLARGPKSVRGSLQVGAPLPTPQPAETERDRSANHEDRVDPNPPARSDDESAEGATDASNDLRPTDLERGDRSTNDHADDAWQGLEEDRSSFLVLAIVGGLFLLGLVAVIARRR